jgi:hypothetical protein
MYPFTINLVLQVVSLDVCPKGLDNPRSTFFFDTENVTYRVENIGSCSQRRSYISYQVLGALGTARGIAAGVERAVLSLGCLQFV